MYWDYTYILVIIGTVISIIASAGVSSTFKKYSQTTSRRYMRAEQAAQIILQSAGINDVNITHINGALTDNYSPTNMTLNLSDSVYGSTSLAAIGVAAHECGHAIQHKNKYLPLSLRSMAVPVANIGSKLSWPVILLGLILGSETLAEIGIVLFMFVLGFQVITLPVEFNASRRAVNTLKKQGILYDDELPAVRKVLTAAALTYVAAVASSALQLIRLLLITGHGRKK